jgi:RNA polymerase sigma factor (sigma-70 family)
MPENKHYFIRVDGELTPVTEELYRAYHQMARRERYLEERDLTHGKVLYADMDTAETTGEDMIPDLDAVPAEDEAIRNVLIEAMRECVALLDRDERALIHAVYTRGLSQREAAALFGISQPALKKRHDKVIAKLRGLMKI